MLLSCFNPRTREECDRLSLHLGGSPQQFQSTHSRRVRLLKSILLDDVKIVSIHALAKSATSKVLTALHILLSFNPRTREECDIFLFIPEGCANKFQSTHSRRVRHRKIEIDGLHQLFQSTHSRRVRLKLGSWFQLLQIVSIHALAKSATMIIMVQHLIP